MTWIRSTHAGRVYAQGASCACKLCYDSRPSDTCACQHVPCLQTRYAGYLGNDVCCIQCKTAP
eukprot:1267978-Pleurochrysis_carterae.AAC.1